MAYYSRNKSVVLAPLKRKPASAVEERVIEFMGLNQRSVIDDGEMRHMYNLTANDYPCITQRAAREKIAPLGQDTLVQRIISKKDKIAGIDVNGLFWYNGTKYNSLGYMNGAKMISINKYICFFPQKKWFDTTNGTFGSLEESFDQSETTTPSLSIAVVDDVKSDFTRLEFPSNTDMSYDVTTSNFQADDAIMLEGTLEFYENDDTSSEDNKRTYTFSGQTAISTVIKTIGYGQSTQTGDTVALICLPFNTFLEMQSYGAIHGTLKNVVIKRECPDLDYMMEYNNRIWGVSNADNTIYACKLGDPKNWGYFQATSMDSYFAEQGSDGDWTGCAAYSNHLIFFKEECMHKVYGSAPSSFQIATTKCHALEKGSSDSVCIINGVVIYKSKIGIMGYDGGSPSLLSSKLNEMNMRDVVAGTDGSKYYASVMDYNEEDDAKKPKMLVWDMNYRTWHMEDHARAKQFLYYDGRLLFVEPNGVVKAIGASDYNEDGKLNEDKPIEWMAELGPFHEFMENKKIYSKIYLRVNLEHDSELDVYIKVDRGEWEHIRHITNEHGLSLTVPIVPRRCDVFSIKLSGKGRCKVESCTRQYRVGSHR